MAISTLISAWLAGLLGGAHCLAMCGGFVAAFSGARPVAPRSGKAARLMPGRELVRRQLTYNLGRLTTYALLGAIFGGLGTTMLEVTAWPALQRSLFVVANGFLLSLALGLVWKHEGVVSLQRLGGAIAVRCATLVAPLAGADHAAGRYAMGMAWGLVPCALIYAVLPIALFSGGAINGAAVMLAFGAGTMPHLLAVGWLLARSRRWLARPVVRYAAAALLAGFAAVGFWRAIFGSLNGTHGPFCFVL